MVSIKKSIQCNSKKERSAPYTAFLLQGIGQVAVGVREVGLELNGPPVGVYGQVYQALLIVHTGKVAVHNCVIWAQTQGSQISCHSSVKKQQKKGR